MPEQLGEDILIGLDLDKGNSGTAAALFSNSPFLEPRYQRLFSWLLAAATFSSLHAKTNKANSSFPVHLVIGDFWRIIVFEKSDSMPISTYAIHVISYRIWIVSRGATTRSWVEEPTLTTVIPTANEPMSYDDFHLKTVLLDFQLTQTMFLRSSPWFLTSFCRARSKSISTIRIFVRNGSAFIWDSSGGEKDAAADFTFAVFAAALPQQRTGRACDVSMPFVEMRRSTGFNRSIEQQEEKEAGRFASLSFTIHVSQKRRPSDQVDDSLPFRRAPITQLTWASKNQQVAQ
ncbi:hypothetical protein WG66_004496 [Moniliophthora roreri]|nr:hypothetical protein WG66_004496 [Moniliophthora roreri]